MLTYQEIYFQVELLQKRVESLQAIIAATRSRDVEIYKSMRAKNAQYKARIAELEGKLQEATKGNQP